MTDKIESVNIAPSWAGLTPWMLRVLEDPNQSEAAKAPLRAELQRLAEAMDERNEATTRNVLDGIKKGA